MTSDTSTHPVTVDFFCIGAGKSGSSWLAQCLDEHPQITIARNKEPNFFVRKLSAFGGDSNSEFMKDWDWYADQYAHARPGDRLGDFSVNLMHNVDDAPKLIHELYPAAKLIAILRDPVDRTYSHYWHEKEHDRVKGVPDSFEKGLRNRELLFRSRYGEQLEAWRNVFPREAFFLVFDFDLARDAGGVMSQLLGFLGVDSTFQPPSLRARVNESAHVSGLLAPLRKVAAVARSAGLGRVLDFASRYGTQKAVIRRLTTRRPYPPMRTQTRDRLRQELAGDVTRLEKLFRVDLRSWKRKFPR